MRLLFHSCWEPAAVISSANFAMRISSGGSFRYSSMLCGRGVRRQTKLVAVDFGQLRLGFVAIDGVFGDRDCRQLPRRPYSRAGNFLSDSAASPPEKRRWFRAAPSERDNEWIGPRAPTRHAGPPGRRQPIASIARRSQLGLFERIRPDSAVKSAQRNPAPLQVVSALQIVLDLDVHDDRTGLLNLADAAELHAIGEAGGDIARRACRRSGSVTKRGEERRRSGNCQPESSA